MPMPSNDERADWALAALAAFAAETGQAAARDGLREIVSDLLCNLQHLCAREGVDFKDALADGTGNHEFEVKHPGE
jgi:hypothetical protein